ncbi:MAG: haloacid dehalogenase [Desulfurococcales archaeon]|nr:haloacid dehalogenase [Desulfurococcales archaeon]
MDDNVIDKLRSIVDDADRYLSERDSVREKAIRVSREVIRYSGWSVTSVHKGDIEEAERNLSIASEKARELINMARPYPEIYYSGMVYNALSEYAEAMILMSIVKGLEIPGFKGLDIPPVPYLQGLGDVVGELRRLIFEHVRRGEINESWRLLSIMEAIYMELRRLDYPEGLAPGIRHKADVARRLIDDTKSFLVDIESRSRLEALLRDFKG